MVIMALLLASSHKGLQANYWKITLIKYDYLSSRTSIVLGLYGSMASRQADVNNVLSTKKFFFSGLHDRASSYSLIKTPPNTPSVPETVAFPDLFIFDSATDI